MQVAFVSDDQRVDLKKCQILVVEQLGETQEDLGELLHLIAFQTQRERQLTRLVGLCADQRIDFSFENLFRRLFGDGFNLNTAFGRGHEDHTAGSTVNDRAQVELVGDVGAGLY